MTSQWATGPEDRRHKLTFTLAVTAWIAAIVLAVLRAAETIGTNWGSFAILAIGVAIAATISLSRQRLAHIVVEAFQKGLEVGARRMEQTHDLDQPTPGGPACRR